MKITDIKAEELKSRSDEEGMVFQGCGGDTKEWVDGINKLLKDEKILTGGTQLSDCYRFENNGLTNLYFPFGNAKLDMGKLPLWRLKAREVFGCMWLSDYVENYLGGFVKDVQNNEELARKVYDTVYVPQFLSDEFRVGQDPVCYEEFLSNDWADEDSRKYYLDLLARKDATIDLTQA